ncbi:MAG TPA: hypothetical protein VLH18_01070 [Candidatus Limnocylindrales bacterium]|nr:hypothetical protein [Candidatus Limnocylindrales bacterium]
MDFFETNTGLVPAADRCTFFCDPNPHPFNMLGVQLIGAGACLGFMVFNFYPARVYMGDTGRMLLGLILATVHLCTVKYPFSAQLVLGSAFIFAYPALKREAPECA